MEQPISAMMQPVAASVRAEDTVAQAAEEMLRYGVSFVPVLDSDGGPPLGVITMDELMDFRNGDRDPYAVRAGDICADKPAEVGPNTPVGEVARLMVAREIHHVIVTENRNILGVVSSLDFVRQFIPGQPGPGH
jgi:CBS domain-containing protein